MSYSSTEGAPEQANHENMTENPGDESSLSAPGTKPKRVMSTIEFPYNPLSSCVELVETIYAKAGRSAAATADVAAWADSTVTSGTFKLRVSATRMFGFLTGERGMLQLTHLADRLLDPLTEDWAKAQAFLSVELYRKVYEQNRGRLLPKAAGLETEMVALGVSPNQKEKARQVFERSAKEAGFFNLGTDRLVEPTFNVVPASDIKTPAGDSAAEGDSGKPVPLKREVSTVANDPLVQGLLSRMPPPEKGWPAADRARWLRTFAMNLSVIYGEEGGEVEITAPEPKPA